MNRLTVPRAALIAGVVAALVFANSVLNGWAGDDGLIILNNGRAHSLAAAFAARFLPYWPPPWERAGLYRPLAILSYALDWTLAGGATWLFHLENILLHALATALGVAVVAAWLSPVGAMVAGLVFAVHPVHVEAVSNVVGRAELLAACAMLGALLTARRYRHASGPPASRWWLAATCGLVTLGLFSKEHAVITIAVLSLDQALDPSPSVSGRSVRLYVSVALITIVWLTIWRSIVGPYVGSGETTAFFGLSRFQRWMTMLPVQLDVLRLLVWPMDLVSDYSQQTTPLRYGWSVPGVIGMISATAAVVLAFATARRLPALTFGILLAAGSYLPTSNLFLTSGVVLAERNLYLAVLAPAITAALIFTAARDRPFQRPLVMVLAMIMAVFAVRSWTRTPVWKSPLTTIIEEGVDHQENYRAHIHLGDMFAARRDTARALAEYLAASSLAENDPFVGQSIVNSAIALGRHQFAIDQAVHFHALAPEDYRTGRWLAQARMAAGAFREALVSARNDLLRNPGSGPYIETYLETIHDGHAPEWTRLLAAADEDWVIGRLVQASARLDSLAAIVPKIPPGKFECEELEIARHLLPALRPGLLETLLAKTIGCSRGK